MTASTASRAVGSPNSRTARLTDSGLTGCALVGRFAPWVTVTAAASAAVGLALLLQAGEWGGVAALAGVGLGLATGMESDVIAYLSSRYFPASVLSSVLGIMVAAYLAGAAVGPVAITAAEQAAGDSFLFMIVGLLFIASILQLSLGAYGPAARRNPTG